MDNVVITIARGFGSGGKEIGTKLANRLGIVCYDRQLLTIASDNSGIDESLFVETDERLRSQKLASLLHKIPPSTVLEPHDKKFVSDVNLYNIQAEMIRNLAKTESCVIIGKCADYILREYDNVISIYVEAPREACIKSVMSKMYISKERAGQLIQSTDRYRAQYYNYYTKGRNWTNPINYHMILNSDKIGRDHCVDLIIKYIGIKFSE